jgi:microcystin-dependent protein
MSVLIFANNAKTTLAVALTSSATTLTVATGTGALFPSPSGTQYFVLTLVDAATGLLNEIMWCTSRSGDTLTVVRAQEGTSAKAWLLGDYVNCFPTAGTQSTFVQPDQLQKGTYGFSAASGTVNALTATVASDLGSMPDGMSLIVEATGANTGTATLNLTMGSTITGVYPIVKGNNSALVAGDIPIAGYPIQLNWSATLNSWVMQNPALGIDTIPTGVIFQFPCTTAPAGYLIAEGQLVSRTTYAKLWAFAQSSGNISSTDGAWVSGQFSPGDGSTTFRLPQYGGYFLRSLDNGNGIDPSRVIGTVQNGQNVSHTHTATVTDPGHTHTATVSDPGHAHSYTTYANQFNQSGSSTPAWSGTSSATTGTSNTGISVSNATNTTSVSVTNASQGGSETRPINISVLTCIKY